MKTTAVIVTYNRKEMLLKCLDCVLNQTVADLDIILVDNASSDGTYTEIEKLNEKRIKYFNTGANLGGAGGFAFGIKKALENGYDYCWIMDDDTLPNVDSLTSMLEKIAIVKASYLCSRVLWTDGSACVMNTPPNGKPGCLHDEKALDLHLIQIKGCSFVSCLVDMSIVEKAGLPIAEFFIYGDDVEFTRRLESFGAGYIDLDSVVTHAMPSNSAVGLALCDKNRINRYKYGVRNNIYINRVHDHMCFPSLVLRNMKAIASILRHSKDHKLNRIYIQTIGFIKGVFFNPKIVIIERGKNK